MIRLYTNTNLLTEENRRFVFPLLFDLFFVKNTFLNTYYKIVKSVNECDIVVLPLEYAYSIKKCPSDVDRTFKKAKTLNKPIWVYSGGDFGYSIKSDKTFNFRLGGFKTKLNADTIIMPSFINDPYKLNLKRGFQTLEKENRPKIGFVGHAKGGIVKYMKEFLVYAKINMKRVLKREVKDYQPFYPSSVKRAKYLRVLETNEKIETDFILRDKYRAGVKTPEEKEKTTNEFYRNIYDNPYTFCIRGAGNFSVRFYETLALGRIPILLNTDCLLPLSNVIDWDKHCIIIDENECKNMEDKILNFHKHIRENSFIDLQKRNRVLWEKVLRRDYFFKEVHNIFVKKLELHEQQ